MVAYALVSKSLSAISLLVKHFSWSNFPLRLALPPLHAARPMSALLMPSRPPRPWDGSIVPAGPQSAHQSEAEREDACCCSHTANPLKNRHPAQERHPMETGPTDLSASSYVFSLLSFRHRVIKKQEVCFYGFIFHVLGMKAHGSLRRNISLSVNGGVRPWQMCSETGQMAGRPAGRR